MRQYTFHEIRSGLASGAVINGNNFAMLHDVELEQPVLVKRIASSMDDVTQSVLLCQDKHRI